MAYQDGSATALGVLSSTIGGDAVPQGYVSMLGALSSSVYATVYNNSITIQMDGTLSSTVSVTSAKSSYSIMIGVLNASVGVEVFCPDIFADMEIQKITNIGCEKGDTMDITRYRGDTYPLETVLGRNGNTDATGITFKMSVQIDNGTIYTSTGTIVDTKNGIVKFEWPAGSIDAAGEGIYDIQGEDSYIYTYVKGKITILDDLTV